MERYPPLVDGAFIIIAWVGSKLALDYMHAAGFIEFEIPQSVSLGLIVVIFLIALIYARAQGPVEKADDDTLREQAEEMLIAEDKAIRWSSIGRLA